MREVQLVSVANSATIGVCDVPEGARHVFLPVIQSIIVEVARVLYPGRIGLSRIYDTVAIDILLAVVELVAVGVVVPRVGGERWVAVGAVDLDTVRDSVPVGVGSGRVREQDEGLIGVVQTVPVGVVVVGVGLGDAVDLCSEYHAATGAESENRVAGRFGGCHVERARTEVLSRGVGRAVSSSPCRVDVLPEVAEAVAVGIAIGPVHVGVGSRVESVSDLPSIWHAVAVGVPAIWILVDGAVAVVVIARAVGITVTVTVEGVDQTVMVVVHLVVADIAHRILVSAIGASPLNDLHGALLVPVPRRHGAVPPDAVVEHRGSRRVVPA